jgi:hypothetical protein
MKSVFAFGASFSAAALLAALAACSSTPSTPAPSPDTPDPPITACDPSKCAAGNECVWMDGDLKCRKPCASNLDPATSCPANFFCATTNAPSVIPPAPGCTKVDVPTSKTLCGAQSTSSGTRLSAYACAEGVTPQGCVLATGTTTNFCCNEAPAETLAKPVCVKQFAEVKPGPKQWGAPCSAIKGLDNNDDCDVAQGFFCYGDSPADARAYCTRYSCQGDRDCGGGFTCATINVAPNVTTGKRTHHETTTACLRRDYGAACKADLDCPPLLGRPQHCVPDDNYVGFCSPECTTNDNCNLEAKCIDVGIGPKTCYPRAGVVVGDGSLCSPCRHDATCGDDGVCVKGEFTTERFCAKKSAATCTATSNKCPPPMKPKTPLGCAIKDGPATPLDNYCYGLYEIGESRDLGCYTPNRL